MRRIIILIVFMLTRWIVPTNAQPQCTVTHYDETNGMAQWFVTQIVQDKKGMIWFATWNGLNRFDGYTLECFKTRVGDGIDLPSNRIQDAVLTDDDNLLCKIEEHIFLFNTKTCKFSKVQPEEERKQLLMFQRRITHPSVPHSDIFECKDKYGVRWAIGRDGHIAYKQNGQWITYPTSIGQYRYLHYGLTDHQGNVWFRSENSVHKLTFSQKSFNMLPQDKPMHVRAFCIDNAKRYWVTTRDDASIRLFDKDNHLLGYLGRDGRLHPSYTSFGSPIYHVMQDTHGTFWLASKPDGLYRLREHNGSFNISHFSLNSNDLYNIAEDQYGRLWVGTFEGGINCIEQPQAEQPVIRNKSNGLSYPQDAAPRVRQIHITENGVLLAATNSGLLVADVSKKDARQVRFKLHSRHAQEAESLSNNALMYVLEDSKHRIFICTETGGIDQIASSNLLAKDLSFSHFNTATGFASDLTQSAIEADGAILIVSSNQLISWNPDNKQTAVFDANYWKHSFRYSEAIPAKLPDGHIIFGLQDGALVVDSKSLRKSTFVPPIALTALSIHNGSPDLAVDGLNTLLLKRPEDRDITIHFAALDYADGGSINYAYQLGDDASWHEIGKEHSATFLNLSPGTYQLKIRSTNSDGVWANNVRTLTIIVEPTFWETRWAQLLYTLILITAVWGVLRTRRYIIRLKRRQQELHEAYLALLNAGSETHDDHQEPMPRQVMKPEDEAFMQRAVAFIESHLSDADINIGDMAEATATSRSGLNRKMKSLLGVTPLDFIREARMRKACAMLKKGLLVKDVAYACGFTDVVYFRKCFKAETGMTPSEYRDENYGR